MRVRKTRLDMFAKFRIEAAGRSHETHFLRCHTVVDREGDLPVPESTSEHHLSTTEGEAVACVQGRQVLAFQRRSDRPLVRRGRRSHKETRLKVAPTHTLTERILRDLHLTPTSPRYCVVSSFEGAGLLLRAFVQLEMSTADRDDDPCDRLNETISDLRITYLLNRGDASTASLITQAMVHPSYPVMGPDKLHRR